VQAIHRARPLIRAVDVWLLTNVPLSDLPVELVSLRELFDAPEGVDVYRWPEVVQLAKQRMDTAGMVTTADLVDAGLCKPAAARRIPRCAVHDSGMGCHHRASSWPGQAAAGMCKA
jgi:hypothetical protein